MKIKKILDLHHKDQHQGQAEEERKQPIKNKKPKQDSHDIRSKQD